MKQFIVGIVFAVSAAFVILPSTGWAKTAKECHAEYKAQKDALKAAGTKKKDFISQCRAEPDNSPATTTQTQPKQVDVPPDTAVPMKANQFLYEPVAKSRCPSGTVVWVNTQSRFYYFAGSPNYGTTPEGAYMCEADTAAAGYRPAKNEKHP